MMSVSSVNISRLVVLSVRQTETRPGTATSGELSHRSSGRLHGKQWRRENVAVIGNRTVDNVHSLPSSLHTEQHKHTPLSKGCQVDKWASLRPEHYTLQPSTPEVQ